MMVRDFGVDLTITPPSGGPAHMVPDGQGGERLPRALFDDAFTAVDVDDETPVGSKDPQLLIPSHELGAAVKGWNLAIAGITYMIAVSKPDGTGFHILVLSLADV